MRTPDIRLRQALSSVLRDVSPPSIPELSRLLGVTRQTVHRLLDEIDPDVLFAAGSPRRTRYALRRSLRGTFGDLPLFAIDANGHGEQLGMLSLVGSDGSFLSLQKSVWPAPAESKEGWWQRLPYPIHAMRPAGYMGRRFARAEHALLDVSDNPDQWSDDDVVWVLSRRGDDVTGNLVLGVLAYEAWLRTTVAAASPLPSRQLARAYAKLADEAVAGAGGGSSAGGEFPKFTTMRDATGAVTSHVLVKFSGASRMASEQRWPASDLRTRFDRSRFRGIHRKRMVDCGRAYAADRSHRRGDRDCHRAAVVVRSIDRQQRHALR